MVPIHCQRSIHQGTKMLKSLHPGASGGGRVDVLLNQAWFLHAEGSSFLAGPLNSGAEPHSCSTVCLFPVQSLVGDLC